MDKAYERGLGKLNYSFFVYLNGDIMRRIRRRERKTISQYGKSDLEHLVAHGDKYGALMLACQQ